ncbi:MAG: DUF5591 domain-containing protein [Candidatus Jordarchaeales archaeon]
MVGNREVRGWLEYVAYNYEPPSHVKVLLLYPCSARKPYHESRLYRQLFKTLSAIGDYRRLVHVVTVSEPFGLVPEDFYVYGRSGPRDWNGSWYECPGLFSWWCSKHLQPYDRKVADKCIDILASYVAAFLRRVRVYRFRVAFVRSFTSGLRVTGDLTHRLIVERASKMAGVSVEVHPPKELVRRIVKERGRLAWDMYGVAHPIAQEYLLDYLRSVVGEL